MTLPSDPDLRPPPTPRRELTTREYLDFIAAEAETPIGSSTLPPDGLASSPELQKLANVRRVVGEKVGDLLALLVDLEVPPARTRQSSRP